MESIRVATAPLPESDEVRAGPRQRSEPFSMLVKRDTRAIRAHFASGRLSAALAVWASLVEIANDRRSRDFRLARKELAAMAGMSTDTLDRVAKELVEIGLLRVEGGTCGKDNRWTLCPAGDEGGAATSGEGVPLTAVGGAAHSGSTRARQDAVTAKKKEVRQQHRARAAAPPPSAVPAAVAAQEEKDDLEKTEAQVLVENYAAAVQGEELPRPRTKPGDERRAADLLERLGPDEIDAALLWALAHEWWRPKISLAFSRFAGALDGIRSQMLENPWRDCDRCREQFVPDQATQRAIERHGDAAEITCRECKEKHNGLGKAGSRQCLEHDRTVIYSGERCPECEKAAEMREAA